MKKIAYNLIFISSIVVILALMFASSTCLRPPRQACFGSTCINLELATTLEERNQGFMYRKELSQDSGMLFIYDEEDVRCFWMENMLIPLDIIWLNKDRKVVYIQENAQPCQSSPCLKTCPQQKAKYVLELNSGIYESLGLKLGDKMIFN